MLDETAEGIIIIIIVRHFILVTLRLDSGYTVKYIASDPWEFPQARGYI